MDLIGTRGYSSYHGRRSGGKIALVAVLLVVFLLAAGYLVLQDFIVYDSDGSVRLELPFFESEEPSVGDGELVDVPPVEILPGDDDELVSGQPQTAAETIRGQLLSAPALCRAADTHLQEARDAGNNSVVVPVKGDNGIFYYTSPLAKTKATDDQAVSQTLLTTALSGGEDLHFVARLSCFHDSFYAFSNMAGTGICQSNGYIWYDNQSSYWLDPSKSAAREYLCAVAQECVAMGFDELLLTEFTYPTQGKLSQIDYSAMTMTKEAALEAFLTELRATVGEEVAISVELPETVILAGRDETAGLDVSRIVPLVDRVYVSAAADKAAVLAALEAAGAGAAESIVVWEENGNYASAFLNG